MLWKKKEGIGLDIGSSAAKLVVLSRAGKRLQISRYGIRELPPEAIVGGEIIDRELVVRAVSELSEELKVKGRNVVTALSGRGVIVKRITTEMVAKEALREAVFCAAEEHIPFDINDVAMDFHVLKSEGKPKTLDVLLVAVRKETVSNLLQLLKEAGIGASVVDINPMAVLNSVSYSEDISKTEIFAVVDVGAESTCITISRESEPFLSWHVSTGARSFAQALQKGLSVTQAEALKILMGEDGKEKDEVVSLILPGLEEIAASLERAVSYLSDTGAGEKLDKLFLCGGGSASLGLTDFFSERFPVNVKVADTVHKMGSAPSPLGSRLAVAIGLALREVT
ncbi:MAG: type IV pilus assembly protein PilM [Candidatus Eisenbacteria bacterium]|nr:type IV pilus assembly protein PilM [Candidatus Eisenbacteria bacterium]